MSAHRYSIPGVPAAVERAAQAAWDHGALVYVDGHCLCCRRATTAPAYIRVAHVGGAFEHTPGDDAATVAALAAAGYVALPGPGAAFEWREARS